MTSYDLKKLNPREFESLSMDILSVLENVRVERFKSGKDGGIDGRFFSHGKKEVIIQCKHYIGSGVAKLIREMPPKFQTKTNQKPIDLLPQIFTNIL